MSTARIGGYTTPTAEAVKLVNDNKVMEELTLRRVEELRDRHAADGRQCNIAFTHFQEGFMALNRAVMKPLRLTDEDIRNIREAGL